MNRIGKRLILTMSPGLSALKTANYELYTGDETWFKILFYDEIYYELSKHNIYIYRKI